MVVLITSCQNRPKEVLNRKQMERVLYDIYVAEATLENDYQLFNSPEKKEAYINEVFKVHRITQAQWDTSLSWYSDRIDLYLKMNDSVKARLQRARTDIDTRLAAMQVQQYTDPSLFKPSYIPGTFTFSPNNGFRFKLDSTDIKEKNIEDEFSFTFSVIGLPTSHTPRISSMLTLQYNDTTLYQWVNITENTTYILPASRFIESDTLTNIHGFVHSQDTTGISSQIRLYNIFLGNDTLSQDDDSLGLAPVGSDSLLLNKERIMKVVQDSL